MLKKPGFLLSSYSNFYCHYCNSPSPSASSSSRPQAPRSRQPSLWNNGQRQYATMQSETSNPGPADEPLWPKLPGNQIPTPYQILRIERGATYSKSRFYELAKFYHPDRHHHSCRHSDIQCLPNLIKIERYRLIVAAHEILSDPAKRRAYDKSGMGWDGKMEFGIPKYRWDQKDDKEWSGFDTNDSPFRNATWEDWERWYQRDKARQDPVYYSNGGFLILVIAAVSLGGWGQAMQVTNHSDLFKQQIAVNHDNASKELMRSRKESIMSNNKDERLHNFLTTRDPHQGGTTDSTGSKNDELLPDPELCVNDGLGQEGTDDMANHEK